MSLKREACGFKLNSFIDETRVDTLAFHMIAGVFNPAVPPRSQEEILCLKNPVQFVRK
jgi:hypothetical protein